jgi:hypothetical protein
LTGGDCDRISLRRRSMRRKIMPNSPGICRLNQEGGQHERDRSGRERLAVSCQEHARRVLPEIFAGFAGVYGDRLFAFKSSATPVGFPYLTGREAHGMLLYRPRFRDPDKAAKPANLPEAEEISPILNPVAADPADLPLDVETPLGEVLAIDDPALLRQLAERAGGRHSLTLLRSERAMTDCRPICSSRCRLPSSWERR